MIIGRGPNCHNCGGLCLFHILYVHLLHFSLYTFIVMHCSLKAAKRFMPPACMSPPVLLHLDIGDVIESSPTPRNCLFLESAFPLGAQKCHVLGANGNRTAISSHRIDSFCFLTFRFLAGVKISHLIQAFHFLFLCKSS